MEKVLLNHSYPTHIISVKMAGLNNICRILFFSNLVLDISGRWPHTIQR
jgi:hypothetical protein